MSDSIKNFRLSDLEGTQGYTRVLLQLFGLPGNGKSSFINSCKFVFSGVFNSHEDEANYLGASTTRRISYDLTKSICIVDNRGMPTLDRFQTGEIFAQLGNLLPLDQEVEWVEDFKVNLDRLMDESSKEDNLYDLIVPVLIHSVKNRIQHDVDTYKNLLRTAQDLTGVTPYIILTHKSHGGLESMQSVFKDMGIEKIYSIENYTKENQTVIREKHNEIIKFFREVLEDTKFRMAHLGDPREERQRHLNFIINYIKESSDIKKDEENENKKWDKKSKKKKGVCGLQ